MYWFFVITFFFNFRIIILVDRKCWLSGQNHLYITQGHIIINFIFYRYQFDVCLFSNVCQKYVFLVVFYFFQLSYDFFLSTDMCWLRRRNHLYIPRSHPNECVYCSAQSFCLLEKQNFLFTSFNLKEAMRLTSTHVMKMTWKQNNRVRRHLGDKMFSSVAKSVSGSQCLCSTKFMFLSQEHTDIHNTHKHDFLHKIITSEEIIISTLDKYCAFIIVNFILYFNKGTNRLSADSLPLNCSLVVCEKTNTAYFYPLRKAEVSISTCHDYSWGKEADWLTQFMPRRPVTGSAR